MTKRLLPLFFLGLLAIAATGRELRPHPRLLTGPGDHPFPSAETAGAPVWVRQADSVITAFSDEVLTLPPVERIKTGKRLLGVSREALKRFFYLSYTYRVHGGDAYARRAVDEMLAVCAFSDWNPSHFLDVGEMAMAVAIGYDWLYGVLTPEERETIVKALKERPSTPLKTRNRPGSILRKTTGIPSATPDSSSPPRPSGTRLRNAAKKSSGRASKATPRPSRPLSKRTAAIPRDTTTGGTASASRSCFSTPWKPLSERISGSWTPAAKLSSHPRNSCNS